LPGLLTEKRGPLPQAPLTLAGAIAPARSLRWCQDQPGAKAPGQRTRPAQGGRCPLLRLGELS